LGSPGNQHSTDPGESKKNFEVLVAILKKNRDSVPLPDFPLREKMTELVDPLMEPTVGEGMALKDQSLLLRLKEAPFSYPFTDVDHADSGIIECWNDGVLE